MQWYVVRSTLLFCLRLSRELCKKDMQSSITPLDWLATWQCCTVLNAAEMYLEPLCIDDGSCFSTKARFPSATLRSSFDEMAFKNEARSFHFLACWPRGSAAQFSIRQHSAARININANFRNLRFRREYDGDSHFWACLPRGSAAQFSCDHGGSCRFTLYLKTIRRHGHVLSLFLFIQLYCTLQSCVPRGNATQF